MPEQYCDVGARKTKYGYCIFKGFNSTKIIIIEKKHQNYNIYFNKNINMLHKAVAVWI